MKSKKIYLLLLIPFFFAFIKVKEFTGTDPIISKKAVAANIVFQSDDHGKTWHDISKGLDDKQDYEFLANENGLFMPAGAGMYHYKPNDFNPLWNKELFISNPGNIKVCRSGMYAIDREGLISKKIAGFNLWTPIFRNFQERNLRTIFETQKGAVLIGSDNGLFKSNDKGKTWEQVLNNGWVIKIVESEGVLLATNQSGIIRSTDGGETWNVVISEGGVGIDVSNINGGFAAITYNTESKTRRVRASYDFGKTWQAIDADLPPHDLIANIIQVGNYFFCGHPNGIYRSADKGKTWETVLPAIGEKVFNIYNLGDVIYALPKNGGC